MSFSGFEVEETTCQGMWVASRNLEHLLFDNQQRNGYPSSTINCKVTEFRKQLE
jgi:hypothetical protein